MDVSQSQFDAIQNQFQTVEEIFIWSATLLSRFGGQIVVVEDDQTTAKAISTGTFTDATGVRRFSFRGSIPLNSNYQETAAKIWNGAGVLVQATSPDSFLS